jgi:sugar phosphate isomerase/epimerase
MYTVLNLTAPVNNLNHCGHIGHIVKDFESMCELAARHQFSGVNIDMDSVLQIGVDEAKKILQQHQLKAASFGLPIDLFGEEAAFLYQTDNFERDANIARQLDCALVLAYLPPFSTKLNFNDLFIQTSKRLCQIKSIFVQYDLKIGFEFIGPTETRLTTKHDFIHTIDGVRALIASAGFYGYGGIKLDIHHWQNSGAGLLDLQHLDREYILYVELNDGLPGYDLFAMPEFERALPLSTGVTQVEAFLKMLQKKGYQGPVVVEPWNRAIQAMTLDDAVYTVKRSLDQCLALVNSQ